MEDEIKLLHEDNEAKAIEIEALKCELADLHRKTALLEASNGSSGGGDISQALTNGQGSQVSHIPATMDDIPSDYSSAFSSSLSSSTDITDTESDDSTQIKQIAKKIKKKTTKSTVGSQPHSRNLIPLCNQQKKCAIFS